MINFGFYNSVNGDRTYNAMDFSRIMNLLVTKGVIPNYGNIFGITPGEGLQVFVDTGMAWFGDTYLGNTELYPLEIEAPDLLLRRYDAIVLEANSHESVRENRIRVIKGFPASNPTKDIPVDTLHLTYLVLAYVEVKPGAVEFEGVDIDIRVGKSQTPFSTSILQSTDIDILFQQWESEFDIWFENVKEQLSDNVVTNLQRQIDERVKIVDKATGQDVLDGTNDDKWVTPKAIVAGNLGNTVLDQTTGDKISVRTRISSVGLKAYNPEYSAIDFEQQIGYHIFRANENNPTTVNVVEYDLVTGNFITQWTFVIPYDTSDEPYMFTRFVGKRFLRVSISQSSIDSASNGRYVVLLDLENKSLYGNHLSSIDSSYYTANYYCTETGIPIIVRTRSGYITSIYYKNASNTWAPLTVSTDAYSNYGFLTSIGNYIYLISQYTESTIVIARIEVGPTSIIQNNPTYLVLDTSLDTSPSLSITAMRVNSQYALRSGTTVSMPVLTYDGSVYKMLMGLLTIDLLTRQHNLESLSQLYPEEFTSNIFSGSGYIGSIGDTDYYGLLEYMNSIYYYTHKVIEVSNDTIVAIWTPERLTSGKDILPYYIFDAHRFRKVNNIPKKNRIAQIGGNIILDVGTKELYIFDTYVGSSYRSRISVNTPAIHATTIPSGDFLPMTIRPFVINNYSTSTGVNYPIKDQGDMSIVLSKIYNEIYTIDE